jgi:DNA-binding NtrC family response regulator
MASVCLPSLPAPILAWAVHVGTDPQRQIRCLIVSSNLDARQRLLQTLESLAVDVIVCSSRTQAEEVLSRQEFEVVFCDERLPDGRYSDLIHANHWEGRIPRIVVTTPAGDWDLYFEALAKGAFDVIRYPGYPSDVEMAVIRALRAEEQEGLRSSQGSLV